MKKRYMFTLTQGKVEEFQAFCKETGLPPATLSNAVDHFIGEMLETLRRVKAKGSFTIKDVFEMMGEQVELLSKEDANVKKRKEKDEAGS